MRGDHAADRLRLRQALAQGRDRRGDRAVIIAARGYPGTPAKGGSIGGIEAAESIEGVTVFHAGTAMRGGSLVANGGRVLAVTARGGSLGEARDRAYGAVEAVDFADGFWRRDIGWREMERQA
jgi:phosphoribosylamine--glycine ligase